MRVYMRERARERFSSKDIKIHSGYKNSSYITAHHEIFLSFLMMPDCNNTKEKQDIAASFTGGHRYGYLLHMNFYSWATPAKEYSKLS